MGSRDYDKDDKDHKDNEGITRKRAHRHARLMSLHEFEFGYDRKLFFKDLNLYFDGEVDFNLDKIAEIVDCPGKLVDLVGRAKENGSHPITEFLQDLFSQAYKNEDEERGETT